MAKKPIKEMTAGSVFTGLNYTGKDHGGDVGNTDWYAAGDARKPSLLGANDVITRFGKAGKRRRKSTLFDEYFNKSFEPDYLIKEWGTSFILTVTQKNLERIVEHMVQDHTEFYDTARDKKGNLKIIFNTDNNNMKDLTGKLTGMFEDRLNKSIFLNVEKTVQPVLTEKEDYLKGGMADGMNCKDLAKEKGIPVKKMKHMVHKVGAKVEREHTNNPSIASEIAKDHIKELGMKYYPELDRMEKKIKRINKHK